MSRLQQLKKLLAKRGVDSLLVLNQANVSYLAGFTTHDSAFFVTTSKAFLITDRRYDTEYRNLVNGENIHTITIEKDIFHTTKKLSAELAVKKIGFENNSIKLSTYEKLKKHISLPLLPTTHLVEGLRLIKTPEEIELLKQAIRITLEAFRFAKAILRPGMKELHLAAEIERFIRLKGASGASFDIIAASGPHSSLPHAQKTNREIRRGEPLLIDMGVDYKGYKSDLTRVFFLGKMDTLFKRVHSVVKTAQEKAIKQIRPGVPIETIDRQARAHIQQQGFGEQFKHSLGHGIGVEVHEQPTIAPRNQTRLREGMVFTIEPAIYLDGKFGVRLEETVLVTKKGVEVLSAIPNQ